MLRPLLVSLALLASPAFAQTPQRLTPERVFSDPGLSGPSARGVAFSPDGRLVTYLRPREDDANVLDLWAVDTAGGEPRRLVDSRALSSGERELSEAEKARRERARVSARGIVEYQWDVQGRSILVPLDGDLYLADAASGAVRQLTKTGADEVDAKVSPRGAYVSFVRDQDVHLLDLASGAERALTTGGDGPISFGVAEFVAQEEMKRFTGYWWAPDDTRVAYTRVDETPVAIVPRLDIGASGATLVEQRYPRAGAANARVQLFVAALAGGAPVEVDLGPDADIYLARVDWSHDGRTLYVQRQDRGQTRLELLAVDPATGRGRVILTETAADWVNLHDDFRPLADGSFLWSSERTGFRHIEHRAADGRLLRTVTKGDWPVSEITGVDEAGGRVLFLASRDTALERHLYSAPFKGRAAQPRQLTEGRGWWTATAGKGAGAFVGGYADPAQPLRTGLYDRDGKRLRWIEENRLDAGHPYAPFLPRHTLPEFGTVKAADGRTDLNYSVLKPPGFDPAKRYPAILYVYGGPGVLSSARRAWGSLEQRLLLEAGFVLFTVDNRGADGRGHAFEAALHDAPGTVEVADQLAGVRWLKAQPYIDPARIGVFGWSYGGYMTLLLMSEPGAGFAAGAAGASPTDWSLYDTHYTERYFGDPRTNAAGYAAGEVTARLPRLQGELLLIHGMADDNVTFDNATRIAAALQAQGRRYEQMFYPGERHGVRGNAKRLHLWRTYLDFFTRTLKPDPAP